MARAFVIVAALGCSHHAAPTILQGSAPPSSAASVAVAALPPPPSCEPRMDLPEGLHDRYLFRDETAERVGYKTKAGVVVIPATFHDGYAFTPGGVAAVIDGTTPFVFIDVTGKVVARAFAFDNGPDYYQEGFARVVGRDGKIGFIGETSGRIEIPPTYDKAAPFCDGKAHVQQAGQEFDIDPHGARIP